MRDSIGETIIKIKALLSGKEVGDAAVVVIVILVGLISFGLGRLSVLGEYMPPISLTNAPLLIQEPLVVGGMVVGSRQGSKYHFPWCAGASQIAERNKVWFDSEDEARQSGYTPAGNCKGLGD